MLGEFKTVFMHALFKWLLTLLHKFHSKKLPLL